MQSTHSDLVPILMQLGLAAGFVLVTIIVSGFLGPKKSSKNKDINFECGVESLGIARVSFKVRYFLVAVLFVLFDVEVIFMYPWAVNFLELGWEGSCTMVTFIFASIVGLHYEFKKKSFE